MAMFMVMVVKKCLAVEIQVDLMLGFDFLTKLGFDFWGNIFDFKEVFFILYSCLSKGIFDFSFHFFQFDTYFLC